MKKFLFICTAFIAVIGLTSCFNEPKGSDTFVFKHGTDSVQVEVVDSTNVEVSDSTEVVVSDSTEVKSE